MKPFSQTTPNAEANPPEAHESHESCPKVAQKEPKVKTELYRLHVFRLGPPYDKEKLKSFFEKFGKIKSVSIKKTKKSTKRSGQGKIIVSDEQTYHKLLTIRDFDFNGKTISVERFLSKTDLEAKEETTAQRRVAIFNLSRKICEEELREFLGGYGQISNLYIVKKVKEVRGKLEQKRYALVTFVEVEDAEKIKEEKILKFKGRVLFANPFIARRKKGGAGKGRKGRKKAKSAVVGDLEGSGVAKNSHKGGSSVDSPEDDGGGVESIRPSIESDSKVEEGSKKRFEENKDQFSKLLASAKTKRVTADAVDLSKSSHKLGDQHDEQTVEEVDGLLKPKSDDHQPDSHMQKAFKKISEVVEGSTDEDDLIASRESLLGSESMKPNSSHSSKGSGGNCTRTLQAASPSHQACCSAQRNLPKTENSETEYFKLSMKTTSKIKKVPFDHSQENIKFKISTKKPKTSIIRNTRQKTTKCSFNVHQTPFYPEQRHSNKL